MGESNNDQNKDNSNFILAVIIFSLIVLVCVIVTFVALSTTSSSNSSSSSGSNSSSTGFFERSARLSDLVIDYETDLSSLGVRFYITPQSDIDDLEMTFKFYDEDKNLLKTLVKTLGDVKESVQVTFTISLTDLSFSVFWNMDSVSWTVTDGTVSIFS